MISAVASRFSGGFSGCGCVSGLKLELYSGIAYGFGEEEVVVLRLDSQVLEYRIGPEALHEILADISTTFCSHADWLRTQLSIWPCLIG